jgi:hypothetical protein
MEDWLITKEELESPKDEAVVERLEQIENTQQYLLGRDEQRRIRSEKHQEQQFKNPARYTRFYKVKNRGTDLSKAEKAFVYDMMGYVSLDNGIFTDERGVPMDIKKITKVCSIGRSTFYSIVGHLIELGILLQITDEEPGKIYYRFNPDYIC